MWLEQWLYRIPLLVRSLFHRGRVEQELDDEFRFHIEQQTELNIAAGMSPSEARRAARREFGNVDARKEDCHDHWVVATIDNILRDLRLAVQRLMGERSFAIGVVLLLALGIGANVAVFSIVNGVLAKPLDYSEPDRLMVVRERIPERGPGTSAVNALHYLEWTACGCFEDVALSEYVMQATLTGDGDPLRLPAVRVTPNAFSVLGVDVSLGRSFVTEDAEPGRNTNIVISDRLWNKQFGADPSIVGKTVTLDAVPFTVIGVLPPGFRYFPAGNAAIDVYAPWPLEIQPWWNWTNNYSYAAVGRLADGVSQQAALDELNAIQAGIAEKYFVGDSASLTLRAELLPLHEWVTGRSRASLYLLLAAVGVALLVACLNIANLMLVRATARSREAGIRVALGATRLAIFRSVFIESALLATAGAVSGVALAWAALKSFATVASSSLPRTMEIQLDWVALLAAAGITAMATLVFGLLPAIRLTQVDPERALKVGGRSATHSNENMRGRRVLVSAEVGLSVLLMVAAALLLVSFLRLDAVERGFDATNVVTADVNLPAARYGDNDSRLNFWNGLRARLKASPGVISVGITSVLPLRGIFFGSTAIREGEQPPDAEHPRVEYRFISEGYFSAIGAPLLRGRHLSEEDYRSNAAVVSQSTARLLWGDENPIGRRFHWNDPDLLFEVIGVVPDIHSVDLETEPNAIVYRPMTAAGNGYIVMTYGAIAIRMAGAPDTVAALLREAVAEIDRDIAVANIQTMEQIESESLGERRLQLYLVGAFGVASLVIAALGIYGVLAYTVSVRSQELALRMALGAGRGKVLALVIRQGMQPVLAGIAMGLIAAMSFGRLLQSLLFDVSPNDIATFATVVALTLLTALFASLLPARRATRSSLLSLLRYE